MLFMDVFAEDTKEWKMKFDPYTTLKKLARYKQPIPEFFEQTHAEVKEWHKTIDRRAHFGTYLFKPEGSHAHDTHCKDSHPNFEPGLQTDLGDDVI